MPRRAVPETTIEIAQKVMDAAFELHSEIGPGCLERLYEICLAKNLRDRGLKVDRQVAMPYQYRGEVIPVAFRADLVVDGSVIAEVKSVPDLPPAFHGQLRTYLAISGMPVGLLFNFGALHLRDGYERFVHNEFYHLPPSRQLRLVSGSLGPRDTSGAAPQGPGA